MLHSTETVNFPYAPSAAACMNECILETEHGMGLTLWNVAQINFRPRLLYNVEVINIV
jgi:hypothetical protein